MLKFNNDNIFTGYLKQLLHSFNLPKIKVYTEEQRKYHEEYLKDTTKQERIEALKREIEALDYEIAHDQSRPDIDELIATRNTFKKDLAEELLATPELNVLESCYRNDIQKYSEYDSKTNKIAAIDYPQFMRYIPYIKDGKIQIYAPKIITNSNGIQEVSYSENDWMPCHFDFGETHWDVHKNKAGLFVPQNYVYNLKIRNYTKNLRIQNNTYDSYTHEYLGDFLRFHRDYKHLDLMPLYNCFSNRVCPRLKKSIIISKPNGENNTVGYTAEFNTNDKHYKIYMVPVKLFKKYTIAIDSSEAVEMCCGLYGQYEYDNSYDDLFRLTYKCFSDMQFKTPVLYDKIQNLNSLTKLTDVTELAQHEQDLKLFIKLPANNTSSIVILEGDYCSYNDSILTDTGRLINHSIINFEGDYQTLHDKLITPLQLLKFNTGESYPFADRLVEYLVGNAITFDDEIGDNIKRAKIAAIKNNKGTKMINDEVWENPLQFIFYNYMNKNYTDEKTNHDVLGYVDKDIEKLYTCPSGTISNMNIYDEWEDK